MDDIERQFLTNVARESSKLSNSMTGENASKYTGMQNKRTEQILRKVVNSNKNGATGSTPVAPVGDFGGISLEPLEITSDMINEIREFDGDVILPENVGRGDVMGNPSVIQSSNTNELVKDDRQMEFSFTKISADEVYNQYDCVLKELTNVKKELQSIKDLIYKIYDE